jgi:hypothetical protein
MLVALLAGLFIILNILDIATTQRVLGNGGYEANPIARLLMRLHLFIPAKIVVVFFVVMIMIGADEGIGVATGIICNGIYLFIVISNLRNI